MPAEPTQDQSNEQRLIAQELSLQRSRPPLDVEGYDIERCLGSGAYGEVWVALDRRTGRRVAIKFYTHRGGVDWSLLSREVEKLVFLSADRYVVQLLDVGWDAEPPYYVMEYVEQGSLDTWLAENGPMNVREAVELFREVAVGLLHAHGRGVLHCDLKPANVLLDQDRKPRLADFGQSRLTHEQLPSLGTLFYMAPEQADLKAVPDARWDVYALGAMLYCTLTGSPPHRTPESIEEIESARDLPDRLARYRQMILTSPRPALHRRVPGMDRALADLIDRCLAADPEDRFSNVQAVLDELDRRERRLARRPLMVLGFAAPVLMLIIMALFGVRGYHRAKLAADDAVTERALDKNLFAAKAVAGRAGEEIQRYFRLVERTAADPQLIEMLRAIQGPSSELEPLLAQLRDPNRNEQPSEARDFLVRHPAREPIQQWVEKLMREQPGSSWFVCDAHGTQVAAVFDEPLSNTVGKNFAWRTYFHGGRDDLIERSPGGHVRRAGPEPGRHLRRIHVSAPFRSTATNRWKVAVSAPVYDGDEFLGVVAHTANIGVFMQFDDSTSGFFAVLVDGRSNGRAGMVLQHPLFDELLAKLDRLPDSISDHRVQFDQFRDGLSSRYEDPLAEHELGEAYNRRWIAAMVPVVLEFRHPRTGERMLRDTGLKVIVQEDYESATLPVHDLGRRLVREGAMALGVVLLVIVVMLLIVFREMRDMPVRARTTTGPMDSTPRHLEPTIETR